MPIDVDLLRWLHRFTGGLAIAFLLGLLAFGLNGCSPSGPVTISVHLHSDATDRDVETEAPTVRTFLYDLGVQFGDMDQVEPPLWTPLEAGLHITITRTLEEREERVITTTERIVRDEFLPPEKGEILAEGSNGIEELVYRITYDGPIVLGRELVERHVVVEPRERVRLVGTKGTIPSVPITGTIAYVANGQAWVMRGESSQKRPLTPEANLDGRVFDLSPDGRRLLYTAVPTRTSEVLNELWIMDTEVLNAHPRALGIQNVLWAAWSPDGRGFAYSSAVVSGGAPGWRALNDLCLVDWPSLAITQVLSPTTSLIYSWWGETWFWAPDGQRLAYAHGDAVGIVDLASPERRPIYAFRPVHTHGDWAWLPAIAWSPGGSRLAALVNQGGEETPSFALLLLHTDTGEVSEIAGDLGPWAGPTWSAAGDSLAFGVPVEIMGGDEGHEPQGAEDTAFSSNYRLHVVPADDWDQVTTVLPLEIATVPYVELCWAPLGTNLIGEPKQLILVHEGDIHLLDIDHETAQALTATGLASHPRWR